MGIFLTSDIVDFMNTMLRRERTRTLVMLSFFTAISYLSIYIVNFKVQFLTFDIKNVLLYETALFLLLIFFCGIPMNRNK